MTGSNRSFIFLAIALLASLGPVACKSNSETPPGTEPEGGDTKTAPDTKPEPGPIVEVEWANTAAEVDLSGAMLGRRLDEVMKNAPFEKPCDLDHLGDGQRSVVFYGAVSCRENAFPENTSVFFYVPRGEGEEGDDLTTPIEAMAWIGGSYFNSADRTNFPLSIGLEKSQATTRFGEPVKSLEIGTDYDTSTDDVDPTPVGDPLVAHRHPQGGADDDTNKVWSLTRGDQIVGFAVGVMPEEAQDEIWRGISTAYFHQLRQQAAGK